MRPLTITVRRSASAKTASMSCSISRIAWSSARRLSSATIRPDSSAPIPARGSSSSRTEGAVASAIAISSARRSPCESDAAATSARDSSPDTTIALGRFVPRAIALGGPQPTRDARVGRLRGQTAIFERGKGAEDIGVLKRSRHAARAMRLRGQPVIDPRPQLDRAGRRSQFARQQVDQRRLAGAVGTDDRVDRRSARASRTRRRRRSGRRSAGSLLVASTGGGSVTIVPGRVDAAQYDPTCVDAPVQSAGRPDLAAAAGTAAMMKAPISSGQCLVSVENHSCSSTYEKVADHGSEQRPHAAEDQHHEHHARLMPGDQLRIDVAFLGCGEIAREPRERSGEQRMPRACSAASR